ncbi:MAG: hypothetical protein Kow0037_22680 [Calditrichia bacterium]
MLRNMSLKWKFIIYTLTMATLAGVIAYFYFPKYLGLVMLFFYIIPSNSFIPFPHEPAIIYYGKIYGPWLTTLTATIPTVIACIIDYAVLMPVFTRTRLARIKETRVYLKTVNYYEKAPFVTNFVAALSPVPFYPVRVLSVASHYPLWKYTLAVALGRVPRYFLLAFFGAVLNIPNWVIAFFFLSLVSSAIWGKLSKRKQAAVAAPQEISLGEDEPEPVLQEVVSSSYTR